jgi:hypothetical protein
MRKILLIAPDWLAADQDESVLRQNLTALSQMAELGELKRISPLPQVETPEALVLGFPPDHVRLAQGPLTVAALGADPPPRSTHFHLTPMSFDNGNLAEIEWDLPGEEVDMAMERAKILNTKTLTIVAGENKDHGLVWEGMGDLGTRDPATASQQGYHASLPEGDNEPALRRFVDDSVNILSELEFNARRVNEGLPPINVLWPWGHGVRLDVPNMAIHRGAPAFVVSQSLRLAGLTRLAGYRHSDRISTRLGMNADWEQIANQAMARDATIIWTSIFKDLRSKGQLDEAQWLSKRIDDLLVDPILSHSRDNPIRLSILAPCSSGEGLSLTYQSRMSSGNTTPFDERALEEKLSSWQLHEAVELLMLD